MEEILARLAALEAEVQALRAEAAARAPSWWWGDGESRAEKPE